MLSKNSILLNQDHASNTLSVAPTYVALRNSEELFLFWHFTMFLLAYGFSQPQSNQPQVNNFWDSKNIHFGLLFFTERRI